jgi:putative CocE/NonD family hydrolase
MRPLNLPAKAALCLAAACALAGAAGPARAAEDPAEKLLIARELPNPEETAKAIREFYTKYEFRVPMRDGVKLFTNVYVPKDRSRRYPVILLRTPYGVAPYGVENYPQAKDTGAFAPAPQLIRYGFIFAFQDVRGKMMSEGDFVDVRPYNAHKRGPKDIDESSDAYDTVDWLLKHLPGHNGRVGLWGNSYPGFYAAQAAIAAHPAVRAVSPQAPVTEWFLGDDFHHNGALCLADAFMFHANFGIPRPKPAPKAKSEFQHDTGDLYDFFMDLGPLANANDQFLSGKISFWNELMAHPDRDEFWQARDPRPYLRDVRPAVLTVGGLFDAEDLFGTLETFRSIARQSPATVNGLVLGPWRHGGWFRTEGDFLGAIAFAAKTSAFYQEKIITPFFLHHLKGARAGAAPKAWVFQTGVNEWRRYDAWPPAAAKPVALYFREGGKLGLAAGGSGAEAADAFLSDPAHPVPFRPGLGPHRDAEYMDEDQRFASRRPDVLTYATEPLREDLTLAGPLRAELWVTTTGTDADFVVKLVDAFPDDAADPDPNPRGVCMGGYQELIRGEVMRGRFRDSFARPEPFAPGVPAQVAFALPDVHHTFRAGHRLMVQVQSSWFPLIDRNPQSFVDIATAKAGDYRAATHRVLRSSEHPSRLEVLVEDGAL